ncbi:phage tail assembly protein [Aliivibrio finisterrensis]|uniref:Phage tail assembly protein n=1 Tax=Aliivibrio finisterrensis TaxID=511998 RepID=A0ABY0I2I3_9GAMM|nr:phage tail assembly protein [Aliivibrio finisterrensis]RYU50044.1 phage tail assembly protein [Aliivibrio finisterrensis]RYU55745.1 phage tail assembly protein [Aliivibrio finisterrensis]RYU62199.1 phage tail assembly protein [Aliivibrio finisterrensis]RYU80936.1 phage tail assembly protein [Aliivibrio finisterrensis]RYU84451.1 phage tail assembly protein [Aliivibrio finisterrensis]
MSKNKLVKITLPTPIMKDDKEVTTIELRKPCAGDLRGLNLTDVCQMDFNAAYEILPRISILNERDLLDIEVENLTPLMVGIANFFVNTKQ